MNIINKGLLGKAVLTNEGAILGKINDFNLDKKTGQIDSIKVKPTSQPNQTKQSGLLKDELEFPSTCFTAVKDIVVIEDFPKQMKTKT